MGVHKRIVTKTKELEEKNKHKDKIHYLYFQRLFSIEQIEHYFKGKYTYREVKSIIKERYKEYHDKEKINGR